MATQPQQPRQVLQQLDQPHDRQLVRVRERLAAGRPHRGPATPRTSMSGARSRNAPISARAERIAGGLAGDDRDPQGASLPDLSRASANQAALRARDEFEQRLELGLRGASAVSCSTAAASGRSLR